MRILAAAFALWCASCACAIAQETHDFARDRATRPIAQKTFLPGDCAPGELMEYVAPPAVPVIYICGNNRDWNLLAAGGTGAPPSGTGFSHVTGGVWDVPAALTNGDIPATLTGKTVDGVSSTTFGFLDPTSSVQTQLNAKAGLASPAFSGAPTVPTATPGTNTTQAASTAFVLANAGSGGGGSLIVTHGAGAPGAACTPPGATLSEYVDDTNQDLWFCSATNTWKKILSTLNTGTFTETGLVGTAPSNPASGSVTCYFSSVSLTQICLDTSGNAFTMVKGATSTAHQFLTNVGADGIQVKAQPAITDISGKIKACTVVIGDPGSASPVLADDNDSPSACVNDTGVDWTITSVSCLANAGSPTVTPILTGGTGTSVLSGALTCGTSAFAAGTLSGTPVVHSFSGATCSTTPCSIDANITTAGGTAKYLVLKIVGTY